jgi:hypothetical protein
VTQDEPQATEAGVSLASARGAVARLRAALSAARSPGEQLEILAELAHAAIGLRAHGEVAAELAAECLDDTITGLTRVRAELPAATEDGREALYLLAQASLLRNAGSDLDDATGYLSDLRRLLPAGDPGRTQIELDLGAALFERCRREGRLADLDEAVAVSAAALRQLDPEDSRRPVVICALAACHAVRFAGYGGAQDDHEAAVAYAAEGLMTPDTAAACHVLMAWMALMRQLDSSHRSAWINRAQVAAARLGGPEADQLRSMLSASPPVDPGDAEEALTHLSLARRSDQLDEELREMIPWLSSLATLSLLAAGRFSGDTRALADQLLGLAASRAPDDPAHGELLALRAMLMAARAPGAPGSDAAAGLAAAEALQQAATQLPVSHLMRPAVLEQLRRHFGRQADAARSADDAAAEVERLIEVLEKAAPGDPEFARTMTAVAIDVLNVWLSRRGAVPLERLAEQLRRATGQLSPDDQMRPVAEAMYWATLSLRGAVEHRPEWIDEAVEGMIRCAESTPADNPWRPFAYAGLAAALMDQWAMTGELRQLRRGRQYLSEASTGRMDDWTAELRPAWVLLFYTRGMLELASFAAEREPVHLDSGIADLERAVGLMPAEDPGRPRIMADLETARTARLSQAEGGPVPKLAPGHQAAARSIAAAARAAGRDHPNFPALAGQAAVALMMQGLAELDTRPMDEAIGLLSDACAVPGLTFRERPRMLDALGFGLLTRYHLTRQPRDLSNSIDRLEEARRAVEQESASPYAANVLRSLASAYRVRGDAARGDVSRAVTIGLAALREHAGDVLLQDSDEHALSTARQLITDADEMARWSLGHDRPGEAIDALELGRGTVLHAATAGAGLADILRDGGYHGLADEWRRETDRPPAPDADAGSDLRYRVMTAIEGSPAEARLLAPPRLADITAALRRCGVDALVYLLPRDGASPGLAVIVYPSGAISAVPLPGLQVHGEGPARAYLRALPAAGQSEEKRAAWQAALDDVCDWAWRSAIRPLLSAVARPAARAPRILLVPTRELGLVPWHAARDRAGSQARYACQQAEFRYAASARQFVDTACLDFRPFAQDPVLISDARASARATELGIAYLQAAFYPRAAVYGAARQSLSRTAGPEIPGSAAATPEDVTAALPHGASGGATLLHFGGHGQASVPVLDSAIILDNRPERAGGRAAGQESVAVRRILDRARARLPSAPGGLVVLASCLTDVAEADYDEALTLATAFVSAGAAGVVAARWRVPDADTALFMMMFHRYLNGPCPAPAAALSATQRWMLDPARRIPEDWPDGLRKQAGQRDLTRPEAWAGIAYQGR